MCQKNTDGTDNTDMKKGHNHESGVSAERTPQGRPLFPPDRVRNQRVVTFLTDREMAKLKQRAEDENSSLSSTCYRVLKKHLK